MKPCPFCRGEMDEMLEHFPDEVLEEGDGLTRVKCPGCYACGPDSSDDRAGAIKKWNTRRKGPKRATTPSGKTVCSDCSIIIGVLSSRCYDCEQRRDRQLTIYNRRRTAMIEKKYPMTDEENELLAAQFTHHAPSADQITRFQEIRDHAHALAVVIFRNCPCSADRSAAIRLLREAVMTANAAIAIVEVFLATGDKT